MGFPESQFEKVKDLPKTHLRHTAGNSMIVQVMEGILKELLWQEMK